jgi:hypothetical protein
MIPSSSLYDLEAQLTPAPRGRVAQIVARLMVHYPRHEDSSRLYSAYVEALSNYPEDLLCAAYRHVLAHHAGPAMPPLEALVAFMEPAMAQRKAAWRALAMQQAEAEA